MDPNSAPDLSLSHTVYTTASGKALVRQILSQCKPVAIEPHDYQCEGICRALASDGDDVVATMATGAGKTGLLSFLMLVVRAISQDPSLALQNRMFPKNPCMIVICPTKALEEDMVCKLIPWLRNGETDPGKSTELEYVGIWTAYNGYQFRHNSSSTIN